MSFSFALTSSSFQKYSWRPCTHSKYETTTPPAFARMSGRTSTPRSSRISSAAGAVAEALDGDPQPREARPLLRDRLDDAVEGAAGGRLEAAERAADGQRLARDHAEHRVPLVHRIGVEDPCHHARIGADVRRRN